MKNRKLFFLICVAIFIVPLSCLIPVGVELWYIQFLALFSIGCLGISIYLWDKNKLLSLFTGYCLFNGIVVARQHPKTIIVLIMIYFGCLAVEVISSFSKSQKKKILWCIVGLAFIQGVFIVIQFFGLDPFFIATKEERFFRTVGFSGSRNQIGLFFAIVSPLVLAQAPILLSLIIFGIFCSATNSAWIGLIFGCLTLAFFKYGQFCKVFILLGICTVLFFYSFEDVSRGAYKERLELYKHTISLVEGEYAVMKIKKKNVTAIKELTCNKWFGFGLATFSRIAPYTQDKFVRKDRDHLQSHVYTHAHNDLLEVWFELGRIGFLLALALIFKLVWDFIKARKTTLLVISFSCLVAQIVASQGIFTVHTAISGMLLIIFYGIFVGEIRLQKGVQNV